MTFLAITLSLAGVAFVVMTLRARAPVTTQDEREMVARNARAWRST